MNEFHRPTSYGLTLIERYSSTDLVYLQQKETDRLICNRDLLQEIARY